MAVRSKICKKIIDKWRKSVVQLVCGAPAGLDAANFNINLSGFEKC